MAGIYIHIPFCKKACYYCNFHFSTSLRHKDAMLESIQKELVLRSDYLGSKEIESIYFGGGTPSLLDGAELSELLTIIQEKFIVSEKAEITLEANPDDLDRSSLQALKRAGVNRLSIGVQSFREAELIWMNRSHNAGQAHQCIIDAQDLGFDNISIDLIYGIPISSMEYWQENVHRFLGYNVAHISCYALTIEEGTVFGNWLKKKKINETPDLEMEAQFYWMHETLANAGFQHYEISNLSRTGREAVHNTNYWKSIPYIGVGPSAHSYDGVSRQWNLANNALYMKELNGGGKYFEREELDVVTRFNEQVMLGLRTVYGIDRAQINDLSADLLGLLDANVAPYLKDGKVILKDDHYTLNTNALFLADGIASSLFYVD